MKLHHVTLITTKKLTGKKVHGLFCESELIYIADLTWRKMPIVMTEFDIRNTTNIVYLLGSYLVLAKV